MTTCAAKTSTVVQHSLPDPSPWLLALGRVVLTESVDRDTIMPRRRAIEWLGCSPSVFDALVAAGLPSVAFDPSTGEPSYDFYDVVNVGLAAGRGTSLGELSQRSLLRYTASDPTSWLAPRAWSVLLTYRCGSEEASGRHGCDDRAWDVAHPELLPFEGRLSRVLTEVDPAVNAVHVQVRCSLQGSRRTVVSDHVRDAYMEVLDALVSGRRRYQWLPHKLRHDPERARALGVADCLVVSGELTQRLLSDGFEARTRTVTALGLTGIDHSLAEVRDTDGQWKVLDPVFAHIGAAMPRTRPEYADFCCGSVSNRVLPWKTSAAAGVAQHHCALPTARVTSTIHTGALSHVPA
jgi:hypothetical protein